MKIIFAVTLAALLAVQTSLPAADAPSVSHPNVLMIVIDDLNDWVGYLGGHPQASTPCMDALAASGTAFANAFGGTVLIVVADNVALKGVSLGTKALNGWLGQIKSSTSPSIIPDIVTIL